MGGLWHSFTTRWFSPWVSPCFSSQEAEAQDIRVFHEFQAIFVLERPSILTQPDTDETLQSWERTISLRSVYLCLPRPSKYISKKYILTLNHVGFSMIYLRIPHNFSTSIVGGRVSRLIIPRLTLGKAEEPLSCEVPICPMNMARCHVFGSPELGHPKSHPKNAKKTKNIDDETNSIDHIIDAFFSFTTSFQPHRGQSRSPKSDGCAAPSSRNCCAPWSHAPPTACPGAGWAGELGPKKTLELWKRPHLHG